VLIPVHNEALRIAPLFESLAIQDYSRCEIIFIDDRSTDESPAMLRSFAAANPHTKILTLTENPGINKKQFALTEGIKLALGELILLTDADCRIPPHWISAMAARMVNPQTGVIIAPVFKRLAKKNFFHLYQCFDHIVRYIYLASSIGLGAAGGGFGNNIIMRKEALDAIGGYDKVPPSPTEDASLISMIRSSTRFQLRAACGEDVFVVTGDEKKRIDFIGQTLRWNNGGLFSPDILTRFNFNYLMLSITFCVFAIPAVFFFPVVWPMVAAVYMVIGMDTISALTIFRRGLPKAGFAYFFQFLFTPIYFAFLTILGYLHIKPKWKGNKI
jgi:cellulose synthase/poly-beta-1,6-N-acetylglucosamine synthase-like glycosyltransferase